ncbi:hypothetical protein P7H16_07555 [Paenibacillus larvae]|nr:hypothetical protein [Paenibacillus larvae]MDT2246836.1 hypothetical protein [Paenibacillus larvae]
MGGRRGTGIRQRLVLPILVNPVLIGSAVLATLIIVLRGKEALSRKEDGNWLIGLLTVAMLIASVLFLSWTGVMDDFFVPLFSSLLLSVGLVMSGAWLNRSFVYIGLLLFLFTGISGYCYLGYTPIILPVAGEVALLLPAACFAEADAG